MDSGEAGSHLPGKATNERGKKVAHVDNQGARAGETPLSLLIAVWTYRLICRIERLFQRDPTTARG
jgi:hypothetical protein